MSGRQAALIEPGMDVYDGNGERIGTVAYTYHQLLAWGSETDERVFEEMIEVRTGLFGWGRHLHVPQDLVERVSPGCLFLAESRPELQRLARP